MILAKYIFLCCFLAGVIGSFKSSNIRTFVSGDLTSVDPTLIYIPLADYYFLLFHFMHI